MKLIAFLSCLLSLSVCSVSASASVLVDTKKVPKWYQTLLTREADVQQTTRLTDDDLGIDANIVGSLQAIDAMGLDGPLHYSINIDTDADIQCYSFNAFDGVSNVLHNVVNHNLEGYAATVDKDLAGSLIYSIDSALLNDTPYVAFNTLYTLGKGRQKEQGMIKAAAAKTGETVQVCTHNEVGYQQAFTDVFASFVNAFSGPIRGDVFMQHISDMSVDGVSVGYLREIYSFDAEGNIHSSRESAMLLPLNDAFLLRADAFSEEWSTVNGETLRSTAFAVNNNQEAFSLALNPVAGEWNVQGQLKGQALDLTLDHKASLLSSYGAYLASEHLMSSDQNKAEFTRWTSDLDPSQAFPFTLSKVEDNPNTNLEMTLGTITKCLRVDKAGVPLWAKMTRGPMTLEMTEAYREGAPRVSQVASSY